MTEQVLVGKLLHPDAVLSKKEMVSIESWNYRAMWSWLRLQHTRKIDAIIKAEVSEKYPNRVKRLKAMEEFFRAHADLGTKQRELQYIMSGSTVQAVASLKHLLIPAETVFSTAEKLIGRSLDEVEGIYGKVYYPNDVSETLRMGLQVFAGTITTRYAIRVSNFMFVKSCLNPLSWLGMGGFSKWTAGTDIGRYFRVLRIKVISELEPRLNDAIASGLSNLERIQQSVEHTKKVSVRPRTARKIMAAMSLSYGLGAKTTKQVLEQFSSETKSQYGMAMATSWVARNGEFKEGVQSSTQKLSDVSAAILMIHDMKKARQLSVDWLKSHIKKGSLKTTKELIEELGL